MENKIKERRAMMENHLLYKLASMHQAIMSDNFGWKNRLLLPAESKRRMSTVCLFIYAHIHMCMEERFDRPQSIHVYCQETLDDMERC